MDFKELAGKYISYHNNPLINVELPTTKFFLEDPNQQKCKLEKYQNTLGESLNYVRVERRCARSKAIWMDDLHLCKIIKLVGPILKKFGFQDKRGIFLLLEEALFLLEQNKLEITFNGTEISICEAYDLLLTKSTLKTYRVYKKLVGQGFKLLNKEAISKFYSTESILDKNTDVAHAIKRTKKISEDCSGKLRKIDYNISFIDSAKEYKSAKSVSQIDFQDIFQQLQNCAPKLIPSNNTLQTPDYFGFLPSSAVKHRHDFNLYIREKIQFKDFETLQDIPNIVAICSGDDIAFYKLPTVNISVLT